MDTTRSSLSDRIQGLLPFLQELDGLILWEGDSGSRPSREDEPEVVARLRQAIADSGLVLYDFDWIAWEKEVRVCWDIVAVAGSDLPTLRRVLTAHVRADRYFGGHLEAACRHGVISALLRRLGAIARQVESETRWRSGKPPLPGRHPRYTTPPSS